MFLYELWNMYFAVQLRWENPTVIKIHYTHLCCTLVASNNVQLIQNSVSLCDIDLCYL